MAPQRRGTMPSAFAHAVHAAAPSAVTVSTPPASRRVREPGAHKGDALLPDEDPGQSPPNTGDLSRSLIAPLHHSISDSLEGRTQTLPGTTSNRRYE